MAEVVPIFITPTQSLLHNNNIGITNRKTSNFKMELVRSILLYYVVMHQFMITIIEAPFVSTLVHTIVGIKSKP
jgi:hypothetical protein